MSYRKYGQGWFKESDRHRLARLGIRTGRKTASIGYGLSKINYTKEEVKKELKKYGKSEKGNFQVIDTIGVPHPYMITPKHVAVASDEFMGMLGKDAIREAEKSHKAVCGICKGKLSYDEHKTALLVSCKQEIKGNKELHKYLLKIKAMAIKDNYEGFAFKKDF